MIEKQITVMKFDELHEEVKYVDTPYFVERKEENGEIVWYGLETNWKYSDGKWFVLVRMIWEECEKPKYEELYEKELEVVI